MLSQKLQDAINEQINFELYSEYTYLSMAAYLQANDLDGIANFFTVQTQEERFHAMKFYNYLLERGGRIILKPIAGPEVEFKTVLEVFEKTMTHEKEVTRRINALMDLAKQENDHATVSFLQWFLDEQVEEEATVSKILGKLKYIGENGPGLLMLDQELAQRVFNPPVNEA